MHSYKTIHPAFRLNGACLGREDLIEVGYSLVKEGEPHERELGDFLLDWLSEQPAIRVKTSGSTGVPADLVLRKEHMSNSALATGNLFQLLPGDSAVLCLPVRFIAGKMMLVRAMVLGLSLDTPPPSSEPLQGLEGPYDFCAMVPQQFLNSLAQLPRVKTLIVGGAPLGEQGIKAARLLPTRVFETFGMTETCSHIAVRRVNPLQPAFHTLPGVTVKEDSRGCLVIHAPEITSAPVVTNDLVRCLSETQFEWLGRLDHVINSGGIKLQPEQIEKKLLKATDHRFFVIGMPDTVLGQKLVMIVEGHPEPEALMQHIRSLPSLSAYEVPKEVLNAPAFEQTQSGKVNRRATLEKMGYGAS